MFEHAPTYFLIIGNIISMGSACFTAAASYVRKKEHIYLCQIWQCALLSLASLFFQSYAGITTLMLCAIRNFIIMKGWYTGKICGIFCVLVGVLGFICNNRGIIGIIPICATLLYTIWSYFARNEFSIKCNIIINLSLWVLYEGLIMDISSIIMDGIAIIIAIGSLLRIKRRGRRHISEQPNY